ncbi:hypothetical protein SGLAM104S_00189 [Streptomyces glaucescens]
MKAALDVLRDLRNEIRLIVDHAGLTGASRRDHLDRWLPLNAFLSIGPPRRRIEELAALIAAGVVEVLGPGAGGAVRGRGLDGALFAGAGVGGTGDDARRGPAARARSAAHRRLLRRAAGRRAGRAPTRSAGTRRAGWT